MQLLRTRQIIETADRHLAEIPTTNLDRLEVESYLAQMASIRLVAEMEVALRDVVKARLAHGGDVKLATFLSKIKDNEVSRMKRREVSETVALFGDDCKAEFQARHSPEDLSVYSKVVAERHMTAHRDGSDVTLADVRAAVDTAERIVESVRIAIA